MHVVIKSSALEPVRRHVDTAQQSKSVDGAARSDEGEDDRTGRTIQSGVFPEETTELSMTGPEEK